jgi:signal transduction histidine kinase/DNA-binding NarL/FixJ family response regulator
MRHIAGWFAQTGLVALAYLAAAQVGQLLTLPPDPTALVSPAAGVALAAILLGGARLWPGVFAGCFAFHAWLSPQTGEGALLFSAAISIGAVLQAVLGAWLIRRFVGYPTSLLENRDIWLFLALAGPVQGLIDATWNTVCRSIHDDSWAGFAADWLHAWASNALGAVLVLLLILPLVGRPREVWRPRLVSVGVPLLLLLTAVALFVMVARGWERERIGGELAAEAKQGVQGVEGWFRNGTVGLNAWRADVGSFAGLPRAEIHRRAGALLGYHDTLRAVALAVVVSQQERKDFEAKEPRRAFSPFRIRRPVPDGGPAPDQNSYVCLTLIHPRSQEEKVRGWDLAEAGDDSRRALRQAAETNTPVALPFLPLGHGTRSDNSLLVAAAVYASDQPPPTPQERVQQTRAYAVAVFNMDVIVGKATTRLVAQGIVPSWQPVRDTDGPILRWERSGVEAVLPVELAGNAGEVRFRAGRDWLAQRQTRHVWLILVLGLTLVVLLGATLLTATGRTALVQTEVRQRTAELRHEVEERRRAEESLRQAKEAAEAASRAKSEFLANVSHELRTPMNGIIGMTDLALDTSLTSDQREYLTLVQSSAGSLLTLLNDLLDFSKIEAGKMDLESVDFSLRSVLRDTLAALEPRARAKGLELTTRISDDVPNALCGDPGRLRQVLVNLAGNAIKFTERGRVAVEVSRAEGTGSGTAQLQFSVRDTGIGIPPEKHQRIFEAFEQADNSMSRKYGGTGLGLAISSRLIALLGGRVWLESAVGQGSTFHFTTEFARSSRPQALAEAPAAPLAPRPPDRRLHILLAEDNDINQKLVAALLHKWGHAVTIAGDGKAVLEAVQRQAFDLVLMDIQMPEMNGFEVTARIRALEEGTDRRVRIIALTAHAMRGDRERCLQAGMDGYLAKPVRAHELIETITGAAEQIVVRADRQPADVPAPGALLDPDVVRDTFGGDGQLFRESAQLFLHRCPELLAEIRECVSRRDAAGLTRAAHTFHGLVGFFSPRTGDAAACLVKLGRSGDLADAVEANVTLEELVGRLQRELAEITAARVTVEPK